MISDTGAGFSSDTFGCFGFPLSVLFRECYVLAVRSSTREILWNGGRIQIFGNNLYKSKSIQEEIKSRLKSGNAHYHSVQNLFSSSLLSKNSRIKLYRIIILPVVLYGCETWSLTLREERRLRVFENRVSRRIFGPKRDDVTGEWRKLHIEELNDLYSSPNILWLIKLRRKGWAGHVACMGRVEWIQGCGGES